MGKKKIAIERVIEKRRRTVIKNKRRNGLVKKAMELGKLCEQQIYLVIYDPEYERIIQFQSDHSFHIDRVSAKVKELSKLKTKLSLRTYTNDDFEGKFFNDTTVTEIANTIMNGDEVGWIGNEDMFESTEKKEDDGESNKLSGMYKYPVPKLEEG